MEFMSGILNEFFDFVIGILPHSPFTQFLNRFEQLPALGWLNWFVPVGDMLKVLTFWLGALAVYYAYSVILRWVKVIGD